MGNNEKRTARDEEERTFGKRRGAKRSNEKQEYLKETETENRRRGRERQFLRKIVGRDGARAFFGRALLQFCAMQVWRWVQHSSHQLLAALTAYTVFQFQLNWNFSLSLSPRARSTFRSIQRERGGGPDGAVVGGRSASTSMVSASPLLPPPPPPPPSQGGRICL